MLPLFENLIYAFKKHFYFLVLLFDHSARFIKKILCSHRKYKLFAILAFVILLEFSGCTCDLIWLQTKFQGQPESQKLFRNLFEFLQQ